MCGIVGFFRAKPTASGEAHRLLDQMLHSVRHRGPDETGKSIFSNGGFGHQRLSIIDLASGQQPMCHPEKPLVLVLNGEIYNFRDLRHKLEHQGKVFRTKSDTEVVLMAYDAFGEKMFGHLEGMYAFALWDEVRQRLLLARDPIGEKPLYYFVNDSGICFASELKALLAVYPGRPVLNPQAVQWYLATQYVPHPLTMFEGIFKLSPGHQLYWFAETNQIQVVESQELQAKIEADRRKNQGLSIETALSELDERLYRSVQLRVQAADVPVGVFLSGGLDSSLMTAMAKHHTDYPLQTFSVGYRQSRRSEDERVFARATAEALQTDHHEIEIGPETLDELPRIVWHLDEPIADPSLLATDRISAYACKHLKVVITGQGADEIFGGYHKYQRFRYLAKLATLPQWLRRLGRLGLSQVQPSGLSWGRYQLLIAALERQDYQAIWQTYWNFPEQERQLLLPNSPLVSDQAMQLKAALPWDEYLQLQWNDLDHWLPNNLLLGLDKVSMAHGLEARAPFLDPGLVTWTMGLPEDLKWSEGESKYLLRRYARRYLPDSIVDRPKKGFDLPLLDWFWAKGSEIYEELNSSALFEETGLFSRPYVNRLYQRMASGKMKHAQPLWNLYVLKVWYDVFLAGQGRPDLWGETLAVSQR